MLMVLGIVLIAVGALGLLHLLALTLPVSILTIVGGLLMVVVSRR